jgi:hypothetical protein
MYTCCDNSTFYPYLWGKKEYSGGYFFFEQLEIYHNLTYCGAELRVTLIYAFTHTYQVKNNHISF